MELKELYTCSSTIRLSAGLAVVGVTLALAAPAQGSSGTWERAWGKDVQATTSFEICTVAGRCKNGTAATLGGELQAPNGIATDAAGNVYVADTSSSRIQKFDSSGNFERAWGKDVVTGGGTDFEICTVAASCKAGSNATALGGELNSPLGVATDAAGNVYVLDTSNRRVQKFDSSGNFQRAWGKDVVTGGGADFEICTMAVACKAAAATTGLGGELGTPFGIAADAAGNVYVGDTNEQRIQKFDSSGNFQLAWGKDVDMGGGTDFETCAVAADCTGGDAGGLGGEFASPRGVATDAAGKVYVADTINQRVQKFDSSGGFERTWGEDVITGGVTGFEICMAAINCKAGSSGDLGGEFNLPHRLGSDASGNVYVTEISNARIQKFDSSGNFDRAWGKDVVTGGGTGFEICTVAADCRTGTAGILGGEFIAAHGAAPDAAGNVYVVEQGSHRIQKFDSSGNFQRAWGKDVESAFSICTVASSCTFGVSVGVGLGGELNTPTGTAADAAGNVYVADTLNRRVQKFDSSGNFQRAWGKDVDVGGGTGFEICTVAASCRTGTVGSLNGELGNTFGVAADAAGNVYVADASNSRIQKFDSSGNFVLAWGTPGGQGDQFGSPRGVATDAAGNVYVADATNHRIQKFNSSGNFQRAWGKDVNSVGLGTGFEICTLAANCQAGSNATALGGELNGPLGVATDAAGNVYVADASNHRIQKFDAASGNFLRTWGKDVDGDNGGNGFEICTVAPLCQAGSNATALGGELGAPAGIATDATGNVYVADTTKSRIQKFDSSGSFQRAWGKDVDTAGGSGFEICVVPASCKVGVTFGPLGGELTNPQGVTADPAGNLYVADTNSHRIQKFAADPAPPGAPPGAPPANPSPPVTTSPTTAPTGLRGAALKKCKKRFPKGPRRKKCIKKAKLRPV